MKKIISLLIFLLFCSTEDVCSELFKELDPQTEFALMKDLDSVKNEKILRLFEFNCSDTLCCKRGPRGHRGKRGPRGRAGTDASCGFNELFINAEMMFSAVVDDTTIQPVQFTPYSPNPVTMLAWAMPSPLVSPLPPIGANFDLPVDIDKTQPIIIVIHMLVDSSSLISGNMAKLLIDLDFKSNNNLVGTTPPAIAPVQIMSADFVVTPATPPVSSNLRQISVSIPFDILTTLGDWAFIDVSRIPAASSEFSGNIYLSTISIQYHRFC